MHIQKRQKSRNIDIGRDFDWVESWDIKESGDKNLDKDRYKRIISLFYIFVLWMTIIIIDYCLSNV